MQVEAILPTGNRQIVSYVGNFNFKKIKIYKSEKKKNLKKKNKKKKKKII